MYPIIAASYMYHPPSSSKLAGCGRASNAPARARALAPLHRNDGLGPVAAARHHEAGVLGAPGDRAADRRAVGGLRRADDGRARQRRLGRPRRQDDDAGGDHGRRRRGCRACLARRRRARGAGRSAGFVSGPVDDVAPGVRALAAAGGHQRRRGDGRRAPAAVGYGRHELAVVVAVLSTAWVHDGLGDGGAGSNRLESTSTVENSGGRNSGGLLRNGNAEVLSLVSCANMTEEWITYPANTVSTPTRTAFILQEEYIRVFDMSL
ncbi:hypothetical protein PG990_011124 [Apiospora arundinis]